MQHPDDFNLGKLYRAELERLRQAGTLSLWNRDEERQMPAEELTDQMMEDTCNGIVTFLCGNPGFLVDYYKAQVMCGGPIYVSEVHISDEHAQDNTFAARIQFMAVPVVQPTNRVSVTKQ